MTQKNLLAQEVKSISKSPRLKIWILACMLCLGIISVNSHLHENIDGIENAETLENDDSVLSSEVIFTKAVLQLVKKVMAPRA